MINYAEEISTSNRIFVSDFQLGPLLYLIKNGLSVLSLWVDVLPLEVVCPHEALSPQSSLRVSYVLPTLQETVC